MPLAAGGMARIYIGRSTGIGSFERHVVLKLITPLRPGLLTGGTDDYWYLIMPIRLAS